MLVIAPDELRLRARRIRLVIADNDGTLTDGLAWYSEQGELLKSYSLRDGKGVERLRDAGIETTILTAEGNAIATRRGEKLGLRHVFVGAKDKAGRLPEVLRAYGVELSQVAYVGDDVNDLEVIGLVAAHGLTGAPVDGMDEVREAVHHVGRAPAGRGAFRDFAEWLLSLRQGETA